MSRRRLIVNADDFGQTPGINRGIIQAHKNGIVTSVSLMVRWPAAQNAAAYARHNPDFSIGLHVDLGEWVYEYESDRWRPWYEVVDLEDAEAVSAEVKAQLQCFRDLLGRDPTHLDSHQHVHLRNPARRVVTALGLELGVPVRRLTESVTYSGAFYGMSGKGVPFHEAITQESLIDMVHGLSKGTTELGCHPGEDDGSPLVYRSERRLELATLCAPAVVQALQHANVTLISFHDVDATASMP